MKGPVRLRRRHFPCGPFEKTDYDLHTGAPVVFCGASSLLVRFFFYYSTIGGKRQRNEGILPKIAFACARMRGKIFPKTEKTADMLLKFPKKCGILYKVSGGSAGPQGVRDR